MAFAQPVGMRLNFLGGSIGASVDRPPARSGAPIPLARPHADDVQALLKDARALAWRVDLVLDRTLDELPKTTRRAPWLKFLATASGSEPATLRQLLGRHRADANARPDAEGSESSVDAAMNGAELVAAIESRRQAHEAALKRLLAADAAHADVRPLAADPGRWHRAAQLSADRDDAVEAVERCSRALRSVLTVGRMTGLEAHALTSELLDRHIAFLHQRMAQYDDAMKAADTMLEAQRRKIDCLLQAQDVCSAALTEALAHHDACAASLNRTAAALAARERRLSPLEPRVATSDQGTSRDGLAIKRAKLARVHESHALLRKELADATREVTSRAAALSDTDAALARAQQEALDRDPMDGLRDELLDGRDVLARSQPALDRKLSESRARAHAAARLLAQFQATGGDALSNCPPGFDARQLADADGQSLRSGLSRFLRSLPSAHPPAKRALAPLAIVEIMSRGLALACNADAALAARSLEALSSHPPEHWVASARGQGGTVPPDEVEVTPAISRLFRAMASVPRGLEVLDMAAMPGRRALHDDAHRSVLQTFWIARGEAEQPGLAVDVKAWLARAENVAARLLQDADGNWPALLDRLPARDVAAYRAVLNGFVSNARGSAYETTDRMLRQPSDDWIAALQKHRPWPHGMLPRSLHPASGRSPFSPPTLRLLQRQMESQGMSTAKTDAENAVRQAAREMAEQARSGLMRAAPAHAHDEAARHFDAALQAVCEHVARHEGHPLTVARPLNRFRTPEFSHTKRIYDARLGRKDFALIRKATASLLADGTSPGRLDMPSASDDAPGDALPEPFETLFAQAHVSVIDLLDAIGQWLQAQGLLPPPPDERATDVSRGDDGGPAAMRRKVATAKRKVFVRPEDVAAFFRPALEGMRLRDQIGVSEGGTIGATLPFIPYTLPAPVLGGLTATLYSRTTESFLQIRNLNFALDVRVGGTDTRAHEFRAGAGLGLNLGAFKIAVPQFDVRAKLERSKKRYAALRLFHERDGSGRRKHEETIDQAISVLDTLLRWDAPDKQPGGGQPPFSGPLEAVLALHPNARILDGTTASAQTQGRLDLRSYARAGRGPLQFTVQAGASASAGSASEATDERAGHPHQAMRDRSDQRQQAATASAGATIRARGLRYPVSSSAVQGDWYVPGAAGLVDATRDLAVRLRKSGVTLFSVGERTGASFDRTFTRAADLLAEIDAHREAWLMRCTEALPAEDEDTAGSSGQIRRAEHLLQQFENELESSSAFPNTQFSIKYEAQPLAIGLIDGLRAVERLAAMQGDARAEVETREALASLMSLRACWSVKNMAIRSKGKEGREFGFDLLLRWIRTRSAESARVRLSFPPT